MATRNQVLSLFGATPEQVMQRQAQEQAQALQAMQNPYQQVGAVIGTGLGRLFGGESPEVSQARQMQEALQGVDTNDPNALRSLAKTVQGFAPERSLQILDRATQLENEASADELRDLQLESAKFRLESAKGDKVQQEKAKTSAIKMFKNLDGGETYSSAIESGLLSPTDAFKAYQDSRELNITEIQNYNDGTQEVLAGVDNQGRLRQATPAGWQPLSGENWVQGSIPKEGKPDTIKPMISTVKEMEEAMIANPDVLKATEAMAQLPQATLLGFGIPFTGGTDDEKLILIQNELIRRAREIQNNIPEGSQKGINSQDAINQALAELRGQNSTGAITLGKDGKLR